MPRYYELDVCLQEIQPRIWRRLLVPATATFAQLHKAIQDSFGWQEYHLWEFRLPTPEATPLAGLPSDEDFGRPVPDAKGVKLNTYFTGKRRVEWCEYVYDFGDDWVHDVKLMAVRSEKERFKRRLLQGERAAPPEDCGGLPGYQRMLHFLETGEDIWGDGDDALREWLGDWRPDNFDLETVKARFDR